MDDGTLFSFLLGGLAVILLVSANAFFVAAEFALVASRKTRIDALVNEGDQKAKLAQKAIQSLDRYISATQLGITLASLGLGWIGEPAIASVLEETFAGLASPFNLVATHAVAATIAFSIITVLHIVLGELAPKSVALIYPEAVSRWVSGPLILFTVATNPFVWLLNGAALLILRLMGIGSPAGHERLHQPEEIIMLVQQSTEMGRLDKKDVKLIQGVFEFTEKDARDVMTPRTQVIGLEADLTVEEAAARVGDVGRSRYPVYDDSLDDIIGVVHAKQILANLANAKYQKLQAIVTPPLFVPGTREIEDILTDMQRLNQHFAIVLDEYGGTAGILTMEDLIEEIVGPIEDEYDAEQRISVSTDGATLPGSMELDEANERFQLGIDDDQYQTIGGLIFGTLGRLPAAGDRVTVNGTTFEVTEMEGKRVGSLKVVGTAKRSD